MMRSDGDAIKSEQLMDCNVFMYFYRCYQHKLYVEEVKRQRKGNE